MAANDNVTQFQGKQYSFDQLRGLIMAVTHAGVSIEQAGSGWKILAEGANIPNLDTARTYTSAGEAVNFLVGLLLNNDTYKNVITGMAA
jgi:hypothetical protein